MEPEVQKRNDSLISNTIEFIKIREFLDFKDLTKFKIYLAHIFDDLCYYKAGEKIGLSRIKFKEMLKLPTLICDKLFNYLDKNQSSYLDLDEFTIGMSNLFFGSFDETCSIIYSIFNYNENLEVKREEVYMVLSYLPLKKDKGVLDYFNQQKSLSQLKQIIDFTFNGKESLNSKEFTDAILNRNAFIYLQLLCYFYLNCPFKEKTINFVVKYLDKYTSNNGSPSKSQDKDKEVVLKYFTMNFSVVETFLKLGVESKLKEESERLIALKKLDSEIQKEQADLNANNKEKEVKRKLQRSSTQHFDVPRKTNSTTNLKSPFPLKEMLKLSSNNLIEEVDEHDIDDRSPENNKNRVTTPKKCNEPLGLLKLSKEEEISFPKTQRGIRKMGSTMNIHTFSNPKLAEIKEELKEANLPAENEHEDTDFTNGYFYQITGSFIQPVWIELLDDHICVYTDMNREELLKVIRIASCFIQDNGSKLIKNKKLYYMTIKFDTLSYVFYCEEKSVLRLFVTSLRKIVGYRNFFDDYILVEAVLEKESFVIKRGINRKTKQQVEVKIYEKDKTSQLNVKKEIDLLSLLKHPCFNSYIDSYENSEFIFIVVESFSEEVNIREYIFGNSVKVSAKGYMMLICELIDAINYLETFNLIHTNLRADTVKILRESSFLRIKVPILGVVNTLDLNRNPLHNYGVIQYLPPEVLEKKQVNTSANVWAFGITIYQMFAYVAPFDDRPTNSYTPINHESIKYQILKKMPDFDFEKWREVDGYIIDFIKHCLEKDSKKRITIKQMLEEVEWIDLDVIRSYY